MKTKRPSGSHGPHVLAAVLLLACAVNTAMAKTKIDFYYPVQVGGPVTKLIEGYVQQFEAENPDITVAPVYSGNYHETLTKVMTAAKAGTPPAAAVLLAVDKYTLIDADLLEPIDSLATSAPDKAWIDGFMPPFLQGGIAQGKLWSVPFQRSTAVMFYNKDAFKEAGLDPAKPPGTWDEMQAYAKALTKKDASGQTVRWGVGIPGNDGSGQWLFEALAAQNGGTRLVNNDGTRTTLNASKAVEALQYWVDLGKQGVHPPGILQWGTAPADFLAGRIAMIWHTTGNLTNIRTNAKFDFGVAPYPGHPKSASVLGGGNLYIFKGVPADQKAAAYKFIKFLGSDKVLADWSIQTGYVAPREGAWQTPAMKSYVMKVPLAAVARDQLPDAVPEFSTYENDRVIKLLNDALAAALTGKKTPAAALQDAQQAADAALRPYR